MGSFLKQLIALLMKTHSVDLSFYDESFIDKSVQSRVIKAGCSSNDEYLTYLASNKKERLRLVESLRNSYSEFFRNSLTFAVLDRIILPSLIRQKEKKKGNGLRIWSAACASGQEAYSLAILLEEHKTSSNARVKYQIFATDNNETLLEKAQSGVYNTPSLSNMQLKHLNKWFQGEGDTRTINPELKATIEFSQFDLLNDRQSSPPSSIYGDFDIIFCANLLFYYNEKSVDRILTRLTGSLADGGFLVTGEAEREILAKRNLVEVYPQSAIFTLTKSSARFATQN